MIKAIPYLNFARTQEAIDFYKQFGITDIEISTAADPMFDESREEMKLAPDFIMHAQFRLLGELFYCSDTLGNQPIDNAGATICFTFDCKNEAELNKIRDLFTIAEKLNCQITMPLAATEWTELFGMFVDPFGVSWLFSSV